MRHRPDIPYSHALRKLFRNSATRASTRIEIKQTELQNKTDFAPSGELSIRSKSIKGRANPLGINGNTKQSNNDHFLTTLIVSEIESIACDSRDANPSKATLKQSTRGKSTRVAWEYRRMRYRLTEKRDSRWDYYWTSPCTEARNPIK
jgi:hypothetical protein